MSGTPSHLLDLGPDDATRVGLLHEESPLHEFEDLVDEDDGSAPVEHNLPLAPAERHNSEHVLQDGGVEEGEVESHGKSNGVNEDHVLPERQGKERLGRRKCVHGVEHLNNHENGKRDSRSGPGGGIGEDVAANRWEDGAAAMEVGLEGLLVYFCSRERYKELTSW